MEYSSLEMAKVDRENSHEPGQGRTAMNYNTSRVTCRLMAVILTVCFVITIISIVSLVTTTNIQKHIATADVCGNQPCMNGGSCVDNGDGTFSCFCVGGYTGRACSLDFNECGSNPCQNEGACVNSVDKYVCVCKSGWTGLRCETDLDDCSENPCMNGGSCTDNGTDSFVCACADGYTGDTCATEINECLPDPCLNGGTCLNGIDEFVCLCPKKWKGTTCNESAPLVDVARSSMGTTCDVSHTYDWYSCHNLIGDRGRWLSHEGPAGEWIMLYFSVNRHVMTLNIQFSCSNMESCSNFSIIYSDGSTQRISRECVGSPDWSCSGDIPFETYTLDKETVSLKLLCHTSCAPASHDWAINQISVWAIQ